MKGYVTAVKKAISRAMPSAAVARVFINRHRAFVFVIASGLLVVAMTALLATKQYVTTNSSADERTSPANGFDGKLVAPGADTSTQITNIVPEQGGPMDTRINVNGESIKLPKDGTYQKKFRAENGNTTDVHISVNGDSTSSTISSSSSSVQITTPYGTYSQSNGE